MARKHIEFIDEYLCPGDENCGYHDCDYQYFDNHGILIRCKNCKHWGELMNNYGRVTACLMTEMVTGEDDFCSRAEPVDGGGVE